MQSTRYHLDSLYHESVRNLYQQRLDKHLETKTFDTPEQHYQYIKQCLHSAAEEALGKYEPTKRNKPYWWDQEIEEQIKEKRKLHITYLNNKSDENKNKYKGAQAKVRKMITQRKNETWERNCSRINTYLGGSRSTESWRVLRSLRQEKKKDIISPITLEKWDEYFKKLLTEDRRQFQEQNFPNILTTASPLRINNYEVKNICRSLKNGKSPGPGNIPPELIKYGTEKLFKHLTVLFQNCLNGMEIPEEWKTSYMSTIHKKGSKDNCDNYRGIAVLSSISRVYGKILTKKIEGEYTNLEAEEQAGFRAGRSTVDHLFCITQIIEKKISYNQELHLLYVDLKKAYDNIPQNKLWEALELTNINNNLIKAIKNLYRDNTAKIKVGQRISEGFKVNKGLKQGCCLSPTLFKIYLEQALKLWKRKCSNMGITLNNTSLYTLCFADDQIVLAQDYEDLQYMTRKLIEEYTKWGLRVNIAKTEYMCIGGTQQDLVLEEIQEIIKSCKEYKYLGLHITQDGTLDEAIRRRNIQGRKSIGLLNSILWDRSISKTNKHRIYNSIVKSITTYGSEVWQLKERTKRMLEATEMDFWRRSAGRSKLERIRNDRVREVMNVTHTITEDITINQLKWYGHVQRMGEERLPKQLLNWVPQGRRKRGRPRKSWREGIDSEMRERGLDDNLCLDRDEWRLGIRRRHRTF